MTYDRFRLLLTNIHFADNDGMEKGDRLGKIRPIIDMMIERIREVYSPPQQLALDESMVLWRGRLVFRQYIKNKRHKYGIKLYLLCDPDGFVHRILVYTGQKDATSAQPGHTGQVVFQLMRDFLNKGHSLYMDNFYNSVDLAADLLKQDTLVTGTLRQNRKKNPSSILKAKLKKGEAVWLHKDGVVVSKWRDRKDLFMISTEHPHEMVDAPNRHNQQKIKPLAVREYNRFMRGIDFSDQMISYYCCERKGIKWYRKLFFHLMDVMLHNAFILIFKIFPGQISPRKCTLQLFRDEVVRSLLGVGPAPPRGTYKRKPRFQIPTDVTPVVAGRPSRGINFTFLYAFLFVSF